MFNLPIDGQPLPKPRGTLAEVTGRRKLASDIPAQTSKRMVRANTFPGVCAFRRQSFTRPSSLVCPNAYGDVPSGFSAIHCPILIAS